MDEDKLVGLILGNLLETPCTSRNNRMGTITHIAATGLLQQVEFLERHEYPVLDKSEIESRIRFAILQYHNQ